MFRLFECCALSFFERFVLSFSLKIERFVSDSAEIWICGLYLDEYARELNFEGVRWPLLKRLGLLGERVKAHYGETKAENPYLDKDYAECRTSFVVGKHECWPIPQEQIDLMGKENFPQNENWY